MSEKMARQLLPIHPDGGGEIRKSIFKAFLEKSSREDGQGAQSPQSFCLRSSFYPQSLNYPIFLRVMEKTPNDNLASLALLCGFASKNSKIDFLGYTRFLPKAAGRR